MIFIDCPGFLSYLHRVPHLFQICTAYTQIVSPGPWVASPQRKCVLLHSQGDTLSDKTQRRRMFCHLGDKVDSFNS